MNSPMATIDPRRLRREKAVKALFSLPFHPQTDTGDEVANAVFKHQKLIDPLISQAASEWSLPKINKVDLSILRLAVWEMVVEGTTPPKVVINEAVELAKKFGAQQSPAFVNGVLGTILKNQQQGDG